MKTDTSSRSSGGGGADAPGSNQMMTILRARDNAPYLLRECCGDEISLVTEVGMVMMVERTAC